MSYPWINLLPGMMTVTRIFYLYLLLTFFVTFPTTLQIFFKKWFKKIILTSWMIQQQSVTRNGEIIIILDTNNLVFS